MRWKTYIRDINSPRLQKWKLLLLFRDFATYIFHYTQIYFTTQTKTFFGFVHSYDFNWDVKLLEFPHIHGKGNMYYQVGGKYVGSSVELHGITNKLLSANGICCFFKKFCLFIFYFFISVVPSQKLLFSLFVWETCKTESLIFFLLKKVSTYWWQLQSLIRNRNTPINASCIICRTL